MFLGMYVDLKPYNSQLSSIFFS